MQALTTVLTSIGLPPWTLAVAIVALLSFFGPKLVQSIESDRGRRVMKRALLTHGAEKAQVGEEALRLAGEDARAVVLIADEALAQGDKALARKATERLKEIGGRPGDLVRLREALDGAGPLPGTSMEAAIIVERFLDSGMRAGAKEKLERFLKRWPQDAELLALQERVALEEKADGGEPTA